MTEFDKWWNEKMDYAASRHEILGNVTESELKAREQRVAKKGWNAALNKVSEALEIHDTLGDIKYEVNKKLKESYD